MISLAQKHVVWSKKALAKKNNSGLPMSNICLHACSGHADSIPVIVLPWPVLFLIQAKLWSEIVLLVRWHSAFNSHVPGQRQGILEDWPPPDATVWSVPAAGAEDEPSTPYSEQRAMECPDVIRRNLHADSEEDRAERNHRLAKPCVFVARDCQRPRPRIWILPCALSSVHH